jgi:cell fate regulator YaaT (PSP1 superfamily)
MENSDTAQQVSVAAVRFTKVGKLYHFDYSTFPELKPADHVIAETARGRFMGQVMGLVSIDVDDTDYRPILRLATPRDMLLKQHWKSQEDEALTVCREKAEALGGFDDVKFVKAVYNYDGSSLTFLFTAEQKVNANNLWNKLERIFPVQVEMRQIGPRDVAKLLGGYGACGELRCCSSFLTDFSPISIKMAKVQGISLNPSEITGMCGRLRCCLVYEYEQYVQARKGLPKRNKRIGTPEGIGRVIDLHPLQDSVTVYIEEKGRHTFNRDELVPLEEYQALQEKIAAGCQKEDGKPCDHHQENSKPAADQRSGGAPRSHPRRKQQGRDRPQDRQAQDTSAEDKQAASPTGTTDSPPTADQQSDRESKQTNKKRRDKRRSRRYRNKRPKRQDKDKGEQS